MPQAGLFSYKQMLVLVGANKTRSRELNCDFVTVVKHSVEYLHTHSKVN